MPYDLFESLVVNMKNDGIFSGKMCTGGESIVPELFVLGSLRILSSGCTFDTIEELTCIHEETMRVFFKQKFIVWGHLTAMKEICLPNSPSEFRHILGQYEIGGLPGCLGSIDCVHLVWSNCPAAVLSQCKGKEKTPTVAFQVVVSHTRKILSKSQLFYGTINDKTICQYDDVVKQIKMRKVYIMITCGIVMMTKGIKVPTKGCILFVMVVIIIGQYSYHHININLMVLYITPLRLI